MIIYISTRIRLFLVATLLTATVTCSAQTNEAVTKLKQHIARIDTAFKNNSLEDFNKVVALESMRELYASVVAEKLLRLPGKSRIISMDRDSAYVLLSGLFLYGNSGDETNFSNNYTGIYKFELIDGWWQIKERMEIDRANQIKKHNLSVAVFPKKGIKVTDSLTIDINDHLGFAVKLNHKARLDKLLLNGSTADFIFTGGLLWVNAKTKKNQQLIIDYVIDVEQDENNKNSSYFSASYGHLRNQYFWHPFFSFSSPNDRADFSLYCTIPKDYHMATSLPQKDAIWGETRVIVAKSEVPTFGLSLYYDQEWQVSTIKKDQLDLVIYATKDFAPDSALLFAHFSKNFDTLQKYFGKPISNYFGIVQDRTGGNGWKNRSNSMVVAGQNGAYLITDKPVPRAVFGHEIAHGWTNPTGPATNYLMEGWATYAESLLLSSVYGDSIVTKFFESQKQHYLNGKFERTESLWDDYSNSGVSYSKGAWLFYMLENQLGKKKMFDAMKNFIASGNQSIPSFITEMSKVAEINLEPYLLTWLKSKEIPALKVQQSANMLRICQEGDIFIFPLEIQLKLKSGRYLNKKVNIHAKEQVLQVFEDTIESYVLDPNHKLLFNIK